MWLTWRQRLDQQSEYRNFAAWPRIDVTLLPKTRRARFLRNQAIVAAALDHQPFKAIAAAHGVDASFVSALMRRALAGDEATDPALTEALLPNRHIRKGQRRLPLSTLAKPRGARGAFDQLLQQVPGLKAGLDATIHAHVKRAAHGQNLKPQALHGTFKRLLAEANWPADTYPYTETDVAYESVRRYLIERIQQEGVRPAPAQQPEPRRPLTETTMFAHVQIDEHTIDVATTLHFEFDGQLFPMRLPRVALLLAVDVSSDAYLAHYLSLTKQCTQDDLLALLHQLHTSWSPLSLATPGLEYKPGAGFPSMLGEPYSSTGVGVFHLDNALMHGALSVRHWMCEVEGATQHYGRPGHPKARNWVEHAFDLLERQLHRFASTSGSHPHDPVKESRTNAKTPPLVTLRALEEAISILLANHNVTPQTRFGHRSPLQVLAAQTQGWLRRLPDHMLSRCNPFIQQDEVPVHWNQREQRRPHINFAYLRYQGAALCHSDLINQYIRIEYDRRDLRTLQAYRLSGVYLGTIYASRSWQRFPHGMTTRKRVMQLTHTDARTRSDPLAGYFAYLLEHKSLPESCLEIVRVYREGDLGRIFMPPIIDGGAPIKPLDLSVAGTRHAIERWHPQRARQRRKPS